MIRRLRKWLRSLNIFLAVGLALFVGLAFWGGFSVVADATSTNSFCTSCHEMAVATSDYEHSLHYTNVYGIRAHCADCHVPTAFFPRVIHMIRAAARDVLGHFSGVIDTPEKYQANLRDMAQYTWDEMIADSSGGCGSCHAFEAMDFSKQPPAAAAAMHPAMLAGTPCVSCHKGIVHALTAALVGPLLAPTPPPAAPAALNAVPAAPSAGSAPVAAGGPPAGPLAAGARAITTVTTPLFLDQGRATSGGTDDGSLLPGSKVEVVTPSGALAQVKITGWQQQGVERAIYALAGQRILDATLQPAAIAKLQQLATQTDAKTGIVWHQVALSASVAATSLTGDPAKLWSEAGNLYSSRCGTCHALAAPDSHLANEWPSLASGMKARTSLSDEQFRLIVKYLQLHAKDTGGQGG